MIDLSKIADLAFNYNWCKFGIWNGNFWVLKFIASKHTHTHKQTNIYIYIYIYKFFTFYMKFSLN